MRKEKDFIKLPAQIDSRFIRICLKKTYTRYISYGLYEGRPLTTKGRWINPLVFKFFDLQTHLPFMKPVVRPIFILGTGRSGSTILGTTLAMHRDVGFLNEPKALWSYLFAHEDLIGSYQIAPAYYRLNESNVTVDIVKKAHRIYGNYLTFSFSNRIVDKYPELIFRTDFVRKIFPDARFLFLYRNGNDTCHSISRWSEKLVREKDNEILDWWGRDDRKWKLLCKQIVSQDKALQPYLNEILQYDDHQLRAAVEWIVSMKEGLFLSSKKVINILPVKYEDYIRNEKTRQDVLKFCGLSADKKYDQFCRDVLKAPDKNKSPILPGYLEKNFSRTMSLLGYD